MSEKFSRRHKYRGFLYVYQRGRCAYCLKQMRLSFNHEHTGGNLATLDHVIPASKKGKTTWENLVLCCSPCNHSKGSKEITPAIPALKLISKGGEVKTYRGLGGQKFTTGFMKIEDNYMEEEMSRFGVNDNRKTASMMSFVELQQETIKRRWINIAVDLKALINDSTLGAETPLEKVIQILEEGPHK